MKAFPDLLVGLGQPDDAAVWRLDERRALVVTTDFFTPIVDDAYTYGAIAAANALSDLYAMGAVPFLALNVAAMPPDLPTDLVRQIFRGGADKVREAGAVIAGGHTVKDKEPKYGLVALGFADIDGLMTKGAARPGDVLLLTKPLGFGVMTTALKRGKAAEEDVADAVAWMTRLNAPASRVAVDRGVRAATDVTGYSLLGHALEVAEAAGVRLTLHAGSIPFLKGARGYAARGCLPDGSANNRLFFGGRVSFAPEVDETTQMLLFDAQTSGGLLLAIPQQLLAGFISQANASGVEGWPIGEVEAGSGIHVAADSFAEASPTERARLSNVVYWPMG